MTDQEVASAAALAGKQQVVSHGFCIVLMHHRKGNDDAKAQGNA